jgi:hypothetical protein
MTDLQTQRTHIVDFLENVQSADSYYIGSAEVHWIPGPQEWMLKLANGDTEYQGNGCGDLIEMIDDEDIADFYESEELADYYADEVAE